MLIILFMALVDNIQADNYPINTSNTKKLIDVSKGKSSSSWHAEKYPKNETTIKAKRKIDNYGAIGGTYYVQPLNAEIIYPSDNNHNNNNYYNMYSTGSLIAQPYVPSYYQSEIGVGGGGGGGLGVGGEINNNNYKQLISYNNDEEILKNNEYNNNNNNNNNNKWIITTEKPYFLPKPIIYENSIFGYREKIPKKIYRYNRHKYKMPIISNQNKYVIRPISHVTSSPIRTVTHLFKYTEDNTVLPIINKLIPTTQEPFMENLPALSIALDHATKDVRNLPPPLPPKPIINNNLIYPWPVTHLSIPPISTNPLANNYYYHLMNKYRENKLKKNKKEEEEDDEEEGKSKDKERNNYNDDDVKKAIEYIKKLKNNNKSEKRNNKKNSNKKSKKHKKQYEDDEKIEKMEKDEKDDVLFDDLMDEDIDIDLDNKKRKDEPKIHEVSFTEDENDESENANYKVVSMPDDDSRNEASLKNIENSQNTNDKLHYAEQESKVVPQKIEATEEQDTTKEAQIGTGNGDERIEFQMHGMNGPDSYKFGYDTGKGENRQFRYEEREQDGTVKGHYGYYDKDGKLQIYSYVANADIGFQSQKGGENNDINV